MAKVNVCVKSGIQIKSFADQRIYEIKEEMDKLNAEKKVWEEVIQLLDPCPDCNGFGEIKHFYAQDYSQMEPCKTCNSTGQRKD